MLIKKFMTGLLSLLTVVMLCPISPVYADESTVEVVNNVEMGNVSIALRSEQYVRTGKGNYTQVEKDGVISYEKVKNGTGDYSLVPWLDPDWSEHIVHPGETVSQLVTVENEGEPAWIRAKLSFSSKASVEHHPTVNGVEQTDITIDPVYLTEDDVTVCDGWVRCEDGFWYYTKSVPTGGEVQLIDAISIPEEWTKDQVAGAKFNVHVQVDAVQERHFEPDFKSKDPWFGTIIETSIYNYTRTDHSTDMNYWVAFEGGAEGLVKFGDDFFSNWTTLMPGDQLEGTVVVSNNYTRKIKLFFRTENEAVTELEKNIYLKIYRGTECIFDGTLAETRNEMVLAVMDPGTQFIIKYNLDVPTTLTNKFDLTDGQVKWIFRAEMLGSYIQNGKLTGVENDTTPYIVMCGGAAIVLVAGGVLLYLRKKKRKTE